MFRSLIPALFLLLAAPPTWAETVTLRQAVQEAVTSRPLARAARQEASAAAAAVGEARSRYFPRIALGENFTWTDEPAASLFIELNQQKLELSTTADAYNFPPARKDFETRLSLDQPIFDTDIAYGRRRAEAGAQAAAAGARWSTEEAAFAAFRAFLAVQQAEAARDWVQTSRQEAQEILRLSGERRQAGVGLKADELRARVYLSEAERRAVTAENDLALARRRLALAMGRNTGEVDIAAPLEPQELTPPAEAHLQRADLEAMRQQRREATLAHKQSRAAYLPRLGLSASYALHDAEVPFGNGADGWTVRAGLSWDIFDGGRRHYAAARTAAAEKAAAERVQEATRQAELAVEEAQRRAAEARLQEATALAALAEAEESYRLTRQRFDAGLVDLSELLATQAALDRVRFDRIQAESRYLLALGNQHFQQGDFVQTLLPASKEEQP